MAFERLRDGERPSSVITSFGFIRTTIYRWSDADTPFNLRIPIIVIGQSVFRRGGLTLYRRPKLTLAG